jgi:NADH pyrophosphatase NudC (nudix superfamily)
MLDRCPGAANLRTPTLAIKKCPQCGEEVEVFSNDVSVKCSRCGFEVFNDILSCVQWCKYAQECVGTETYNKIMAQMKAQEERKAQEKK